MNHTLIIVFYVLLLIQTSFRLIEYCFRVAIPDEQWVPNINKWTQYSNSMALTSSICVELTLIVTMHRLYIALQLINGEIRQDQVRRKEFIVLGIVSIYAIAYLTMQIAFLTVYWDQIVTWLFNLWDGFLIILLLMYSVVILMLNKAMRNLAGDFQSEIRSVNTQFIAFLLSYLTLCVFNTCLSSPKLVEKFGPETFELVYFVMAFFQQIVPPFTVLLLHHIALKQRE